MSKKKRDSSEHSKFWLGKDFESGKEMDLIHLAAYRRAISNFVMILTGKNIPVKFAERSTSFTDGKIVNIGGEITKGQFDATVGLALHEGSHIVKSDFTILKTLWEHVPQYVYDAGNGKLSKNAIADFAKDMLNYVEDRYIDAWAYKNAPGYRGYYLALYDRYFNLPKITEALLSSSYRELTLKNYRMRIINLTNPQSPLDSLPGLEEIYKKLDLVSVMRLTTPNDRFNLACQIVAIVLTEIDKEDEQKTNKINGNSNTPEESSEENSTLSADEVFGGENGEPEKYSTVTKQQELAGGTEQPTDELSADDIEDVEKLVQTQVDFTNRDIQTKPLSPELLKRLETLEQSGVSMIPVGGENGVPSVNCVVVSNMTRELMDDASFPYSSKLSIGKAVHADAVAAGVCLGAMLGRRLQIRNDAKVTHFTRLPRGKIEKRLISELGFGSERVFYQTTVDQFKKAHLHISVDASSSMENKWKRTLTTVVALAKAASMVKNLSVTISFRSGVKICDEYTPYIVTAYDSRKDKFSKITQLFPGLVQEGSTPEGLAFEAIVNTIPPSSPDLDSFFINLSDGEPCYNGGGEFYFGEVAWKHTKKQVDKIRQAGIEVMSYFIEEKEVADDKNSIVLNSKKKLKNNRVESNIVAFKKMYGADSLIIDVDSVTQIAYSMNKKFLSKTN
jgi:hypothetical protein